MRVGITQLSFSGDKKSMQDKIVENIRQLKSDGAQLIVLQELHDSYYFCITEDSSLFDLGESFRDDLEFYAKIAKEFGVVLVSSLFEKRAAGLYHNSSVVFDSDGSIAGKYRKMHIPDDPGFYEKFYFTPGDLGFEPIDTSLGRLGVLVCWDQWFPEAARIMALKGAELLIYPTAIGWFDEDSSDEKRRQLDAWITIQRAHAIANGLPLVSVNRVGFEKDESGCLDGINFWGNSFVVGPQGEFLTRLGESEESRVVEIDFQRVEELRRVWPYLRDRRIDFYSDLLKRYCD